MSESTGRRMLLVIPPFTDTNGPYASVTHLAGYMQRNGVDTTCTDIGIDVIDRLFSASGMRRVAAAAPAGQCPDWAAYAGCVDAVMRFLRGMDPTVALPLSTGRLLPPAAVAAMSRHDDTAVTAATAVTSTGWTVEDRAKLIAGRFLRHIADEVSRHVDDRFAMTSFGGSIPGTSTSFADAARTLLARRSAITTLMEEATTAAIEATRPVMVGVSVPFTGSLCGAIEVAAVIRRISPGTPIVLGGGYVSTELRDLSDPTVFEFFDYVVLDDGYEPLLRIFEARCGTPRGAAELERTFALDGGEVRWFAGVGAHTPHGETGPPAYTGLEVSRYFPLVDTPNLVHRLWSDWRWNKLVMAQGCYWRRCRFCDVDLDYVGRFDRIPAARVVDWMEHLIDVTGRTGFHFVDEAMPPAVLAALSKELIRRGLHTAWWGNIRFERSYTPPRVEILARAGCVAVTGGLETPNDRLLQDMDKGITLADSIRTISAFAASGILVHAYLMYGYPGETLQETVDGFEIVRQLFEAGYLHGAHWHLFSLTRHSPLGRAHLSDGGAPSRAEGLGNLELGYSASAGSANIGHALNAGLAAYKRGVGWERPVSSWFDGPVPEPTFADDFVRRTAVDR